MTFTIVARCPDTLELGICLATSPLGVASRCPHVRSGVAAISSQCHSNWKLGLMGLDMAEQGLSPDEILTSLKAYDPYWDYRQLGIVTLDGKAAAHSPTHGGVYTGHKVGEGFVAMGNGIAGPQVVDAIYDSFAGSGGETFTDRLVMAIEAGYAAGGELIGQRSSGLVVASSDYTHKRPLVDLRVDMANPLPEDGGDAVKDLRRVYDEFKDLIPYYADFWLTNPEVKYKDYKAMKAAA